MGTSHSTLPRSQERVPFQAYQALAGVPRGRLEPHPIVTAILAEDVEQVKWLLKEDLGNIHEKLASFGESLLHLACRLDNIALIKLLLEYGSNPLERSADGRTCLHHCIVGMRRKLTRVDTVLADALTIILCSLPPAHLHKAFDTCSIDGVSICHLAISLRLGKVLAEVFPVLPQIAQLTSISTEGESPEGCAARLVSTSTLTESKEATAVFSTVIKQKNFVEVDAAWWLNCALLTSSDKATSLKNISKRLEFTANPELALSVVITNAFISNYLGLNVGPEEFFLPPPPHIAYHARLLSESAVGTGSHLSDTSSIVPSGVRHCLMRDTLNFIHRHNHVVEQLSNVLHCVSVTSLLGYEDMFNLQKQLSLLMKELASLHHIGPLMTNLIKGLVSVDQSLFTALKFVESRTQLWPFAASEVAGETPFEALQRPGVVQSVMHTLTASVLRGNVSEFEFATLYHDRVEGGVKTYSVNTLSPSCYTDLAPRSYESNFLCMGSLNDAVRSNASRFNDVVTECSGTEKGIDYLADVTVRLLSNSIQLSSSLLAMLSPTHHPIHKWLESLFSPNPTCVSLLSFLNEVSAAIRFKETTCAWSSFSKVSRSHCKESILPPDSRVVDIRRSALRANFIRNADLPLGPFSKQSLSNSRCFAEGSHQFVQIGAKATLPVVMSVFEIHAPNIVMRSPWTICTMFPRRVAGEVFCSSQKATEACADSIYLPEQLKSRLFTVIEFPEEEALQKETLQNVSLEAIDQISHVPSTRAGWASSKRSCICLSKRNSLLKDVAEDHRPPMIMSPLGKVALPRRIASLSADVPEEYTPTSRIDRLDPADLHLLALGVKAIPIGPGSKPTATTFRQLESRVDACYASLCVNSASFIQNQLFL